MTEKEERKAEQLKTVDDYISLLKKLDDAACDMSNIILIDKAMANVSKALEEKTKYILDISKTYRRSQRLFSRWADRRKERQAKKQDKPKTTHCPGLKQMFGRKKADVQEKDVNRLTPSLLPSSETKLSAPQVQPFLDEAKEVEVVEDNKIKQEPASNDDGVLQF